MSTLDDGPSLLHVHSREAKEGEVLPLKITFKDIPPDWLFIFLCSPDWTETTSLGKDLLLLTVSEGFSPSWQEGTAEQLSSLATGACS